MPTELELAKARKLVRLRYSQRAEEDEVVLLMVVKRYQELPAEVRAAVKMEPYPGMESEPVSRGRRFDLEVEYRKSLRDNPIAEEPLVVRVVIAGSGYNGWATQVSSDKGVVREQNWDRVDDLEDDDEAVHFTRDGRSGPDVMFSGTGGPLTKGFSASTGGISDTGSNSIKALVKQIVPMVRETIAASLAEDERKPLTILIKGHSRGAVAASKVYADLKEFFPRAHMELVQVDPVSGPMHRGRSNKIDYTENEEEDGTDETTVVYSVASGYAVGFKPQKVLGAQRIIVSRQNHSVGLKYGFLYNGERYKGASLNSLPPGVYVDMNGNGVQPTSPLVRVDDITTARAAIKRAFQSSDALARDPGRLDVVRAVVADVLNRYAGQV